MESTKKTERYADKESAPICLHALGQGLVTAIHAELREMDTKRQAVIDMLQRYANASKSPHARVAIKEAIAILDC